MNNGRRDKFLFIINPSSGSGTGGDRAGPIKEFMDDRGIDHEIRHTGRRGDAGRFAGDAAGSGFSHVVSVGGDGTSSEIVNAIEGRDVIFTTVPSGSANDFSRTVGIPIEFKAALENVVSGEVKKVDIGKLDGRCFINGLGVGLDGAVANRFKDLRFLGGFFGYLAGALIEAFSFSGFKAEVNAGGRVYRGKFLLAGASNGPTQGGIRLAPGASVTDGLLDVHLISDMKLIKRLVTLSKVLNAGHTEAREVNIVRSDRIKLTIDGEVPAHMDGEPFIMKRGTYNIGIVKKGLKVLVAGS